MTESQIDKQSQSILDKLAELGGAETKESDLIFEGTKMVLPRQFSPQDGIQFLRNWIDAQSATTSFTRVFKYRPNDGAAAMVRALTALFGTGGVGRPIFSFFGVQYPPVETIDVGWDETMQVTKGWIDLPHIEGRLHIGETRDVELGPVFQLTAEIPKRNAAIIDGLCRLIEDELKKRSIYKGKAINGAEDPRFINPWTVDPNTVVYSTDVRAQLEANIWAAIRHTDAMRANKVSLKRSVLLGGPFGTGKSLAAMLTAQVCAEHKNEKDRWTFIQVRPEDDLDLAMQTAVLYSPSVVFYEDVDSIANNGDPEAVQALLDTFDGIGAKGQDVMLVLTTNHVERIHKGMLRPGRMDAIIEIAHLDPEGVEQLVKVLVPENQLADDIDWTQVHEAVEGYLPAFIRETTERAVRYTLARNQGIMSTLTTPDLVHAAHGLRPQYNMMNDAGEGERLPTIDLAVRNVVEMGVDRKLQGAAVFDRDGDKVMALDASDEAKDKRFLGQ